MTLAYFFGYTEYVVMLSRSIDVKPHAHHALQLTFGLERAIVLQIGGDRITAQGIFVSNDRPHLVDSRGGATLNYLIHPESQLGKRLRRQFENQAIGVLESISPAIPADWAQLTCGNMLQASDLLWSGLLDHHEAKEMYDPRIWRVVEYIKKLDTVKVSVEVLAQFIHLSPSRFMYLFRQETGISVRRYILWYRLIKAATQIMQGASFTTAAHDAGFSDSAHLTRTFKEMFGITLKAVFLDASFVQASFCMDQRSGS